MYSCNANVILAIEMTFIGVPLWRPYSLQKYCALLWLRCDGSLAHGEAGGAVNFSDKLTLVGKFSHERWQSTPSRTRTRIRKRSEKGLYEGWLLHAWVRKPDMGQIAQGWLV